MIHLNTVCWENLTHKERNNLESNEIILSVIIPVYNVEKYLDNCLQSVFKQSSDQIEIIIVDDGSTDRSKEICETWQKKEDRMIFLSKKNEGVSIARNIGLELSSGKYIYFIDSDDWIEADHLENILKSLADMKEFDLLLTSHTVDKVTADRTHHKILSTETQKIQNDDTLGLLIMDHQTIGGFVCNKVFSADIIKESKLAFNSGMTIMEDLNFVLNYFSCMKKAALFVPLKGYHYEIREESVTVNQKDPKRVEEYVFIINSFLKTLKVIPEKYTQTKRTLFYFIVGESARFSAYLSKTDEYYDKKYLTSIVKNFLYQYLVSKQPTIKKGKTIYYVVSAYFNNLTRSRNMSFIKGDKHV